MKQQSVHRRGLSLTTRVALASALAASLGGAVAAVASGVTARELIRAHQDQYLLTATRDLASEMQEEFDEEDDEESQRDYGLGGRTWAAVLRHELDDVKLPGARAALSQGGHLIAGDTALQRPPARECVRSKSDLEAHRVCSVKWGPYLVTLGISEEREREQLGLFGRAVLFGAIIGALLGWVLSRRVADWVLAPLHELRDRVRDVQVERVSAAETAGELVLTTPSPGEVEELRQAIAQLVQRLGSALGQARAFAAEAAHELRTPLTTIAGELELLAEIADGQDRHGLQRVRTQVAELSSLVQRLLMLVRADGATDSRLEVVDLSDVTCAVLENLSLPQRERVRTNIADDVIVRGDSALLRAMLGNALENSLKFSSAQVALEISQAEGQARIDVIDEGPGVPEEDRLLVFAPFYRSRSARVSGTAGHGMGLALIAAVAQSHRGSAEFLPRDNGAHLQVVLPLWS